MRRNASLLAALPALAFAQPLTPDYFEKRVRPVLARHCTGCHGAQRQFSSLRLDTRAGFEKGGNRGPAASQLIAAVRRTGALKMPPDSALPAADAAVLEAWTSAGSPWPDEAKPVVGAARHWAFEPVRKPVVPAGVGSNPVDRFVRAKLTAQGLAPAPVADARMLLRRLSFVLTGLPPSAAEVAAFSANPSDEAYRRHVDRLLASPHFGERWARHWMDVVRYGETLGYEWNYEVLGAWRYRDYLIRAYNGDVPYDQMVREHIAGDLLENPRINAGEQLNESATGTAFFRMGEAGHDDCVEFREICLDVVDNQMDTLGKAFLGLSIGCARCHDHKVDPIPTAEYYGLHGVLASSRPVGLTLDPPSRFAGQKRELGRIKDEIRGELSRLWLEGIARWNPAAPGEAVVSSPLGALVGPWEKTRAAFTAEHERRSEHHRKHYTPLEGWIATGLGVEAAPTPAGEFAVDPEGDLAVTGVFPKGWFSHTTTERLNGALRSPWLPKDRKFASLELMGEKLGSIRTVIDNGQIGEVYQTLHEPRLAWRKFPTF